MKLRPIGSNQTEVEIGKYTILFSYQTPVAYHELGVGYFRTDTKYSPTTSKHINKWLASTSGIIVKTVSQEQIESILR